MNDQELIRSLRMCGNVSCSECLKIHTACYRRRWMKTAADRLESLVERRWIPVTERLPEHDNNVLVIVTDRFSNIKLEHAYLLANYEHDCGWTLEMFPEIENPGVTHWMPLPDLPKEVQG